MTHTAVSSSNASAQVSPSSLSKAVLRNYSGNSVDARSFADREFYQDWWNSTSWDQFSRKWNKPVHVSCLLTTFAFPVRSLRSVTFS